MKIVILDAYVENPGDLSWAPLEQLGELTVYDQIPTDPASVIACIGDAQVVVVNKTPIGRAVMDACPGVKCFCILATGYNIIDVNYARTRGIPVCNVPAYGTDAVAQFTIALLLEICSQVALHDRTVHEGKWQNSPQWCYWECPLVELAGKDPGDHWVRPDRPPGGQDCPGHGDAGAGLQSVGVRRGPGDWHLCGPAPAARPVWMWSAFTAPSSPRQRGSSIGRPLPG